MSMTKILLVGGFGDSRSIFGTTFHVHRKLRKWAKRQDGIGKIRAIHFGGSSLCGQSLRKMASSMRRRLNCSTENPYCGIIYSHSMGSLLVKTGVVEGWLDPTALLFCCGAHLGIHERKGAVFERIFWPSDKIRAMLGFNQGAVKSMVNKTYTSYLDQRFVGWLEEHPCTNVLFIGHTGDRLIPIESSVPELYREHPQAAHMIFETKKLDGAVHLAFPFSKTCMKLTKDFINASLSKTNEVPKEHVYA